MTDFMESALRYAADGYPVLPCKPGTKHPLTKKGFHDASTDPTQIREWWTKHPTANIAVVPGEGRAVVVDVDGETGRQTLETLNLPTPGRIVVSPGKGGGYHYWYRLPADHGIVGNSKPWPGIDIRGHNGYVMVPPSIHPETKTPYAYAKDEELTTIPSSYLQTSISESGECRTLLDIRNVLRRVKYKRDAEASAKLAFYIKEILNTGEGDRHTTMIEAVWDLATYVFSGKLTHAQLLTYGEAYETACEPWDVKDDFQSSLVGAYRKMPAPDEGKLYLKMLDTTTPRKAKWAWENKLPLGALSLVAGREGIGKSTVVFDIAARMTKGELEGDLFGKPKGVVIVATEDSWEEKIAPSLIYAGVDQKRVGYVTSTHEDWFTDVVLPDDLDEIEAMCEQVDAGLLVFDPLTSRLARDIDTHKDSDVRRGLEPLAGFARKTGVSCLGLIHVNKGGGDPLNSIMGSKAFTAAARSVMFAAAYDEDTYGLSVIKSNSGPSNQGTQLYRLDVGKVDDGITGVKVEWAGYTSATMAEITADSAKPESSSSKKEAAAWLESYLTTHGAVPSKLVKEAMTAAGHSVRAIKAARDTLGIDVTSVGFPATTTWSLP